MHEPRRRRTSSIRWVLLRSFILLVALSSLTILAIAAYRARQAELALSERLLEESTRQAETDLTQFFKATNTQVHIAYQRGVGGWLHLTSLTDRGAGEVHDELIDRTNQLNRLFVPVMQAYPEITSVQFANERGDGYLILRVGDEWKNRIVSRSAWGNQTLWFEIAFEDGLASIRGHAWKLLDYDPCVRAWYLGALETPPGENHWTAPYTFFTTGDLGITASSRWVDDAGLTNVVMFDVLLKDISRFTTTLRPTPGSLVAILTDDEQVIGLPADPRFDDVEVAKASLLAPPSGLGIPAIADAAVATQESPGAPMKFDSADARWWSVRSHVSLSSSRSLQVLVVIPEDDLLAGVREQQMIVLTVAAIAIAVSFLLSLVMARRYSRPLEELAERSRKIRDLDFSRSEENPMPLRELDQLAQAQNQSITALQSFSKYVPMDVVRELVAKGEVARIGGKLAELTVLFTDVQGFTAVSELLEPQALTDHMAEYFQAMIETIQASGGTVDKLVGDAVVAFWGAPRDNRAHASAAVGAVIACRQRIEQLNRRWEAARKPPLPTRFGLATGPMVVGNMGAQTRLAYTVLGDTVNLASRLEGLNKHYGTDVLASELTVAACGDQFAWRRVDRVAVVGRNEAEVVFELLGPKAGISRDVLDARQAYEAALDSYLAGEFARAVGMLDESRGVLAQDPVAGWLRDAAIRMRDGADGPWEGATRSGRK